MLTTAGDGRDEHDFVAILKGVGLATEEADVFVVDVDVDEAAKLAGLILDLRGERGEGGVDLGDEAGEIGSVAGELLPSIGMADEGGREDDFDADGSAPGDSCQGFVLSGQRLVSRDQGGFGSDAELGEVVREVGEARTDGAVEDVPVCDCVRGLQSVAGDADDRGLVAPDAALRVEASGDRGGDAARSLGKDAFGFGQLLDAGDEFDVGHVLCPAAGGLDHL